MNQTFQVPAQLLDGVVQFIDVSSTTTKRAMDEVNVHRQSKEKAAALCPPLLDHMVKSKVVTAAQRQNAAVMLGAHDTSLQLLKAAVDKIAEQAAYIARLEKGVKTAGDLGSGADARELGVADGVSSSGDYNSLTSPIVGEKTAFVKESDKHLLKLIGK